ncbi:MAG: histidine--tRNA ligase [Phycisphaerales bacterium]
MGSASGSIQGAKGTRDFYPEEMLRRRYITDAWRRTALRHGFDEVDGPVFEHRELYEKKSGEGILNEMFSVFSGKDPGQREALGRGEAAPFGLRPEFTPTLARMYAARARQLPNPCKWFCVSNFFRAERPQRGRLREFWQWNCDVVGGDDLEGIDADVISTLTALLECTGVRPPVARAYVSSRLYLAAFLERSGVGGELAESFVRLVDARDKIGRDEFLRRGREAGLPNSVLIPFSTEDGGYKNVSLTTSWIAERSESKQQELKPFLPIAAALEVAGQSGRDPTTCWAHLDTGIVRGLAYYTGTVFEVIAEGERAVAGGGRYDNLIELFGGPPTPACGFGMGDVVLENLLNDHGLMPKGRDLVRALSEPMPVRADVFVVTNGDEGANAALVPALASLRRGLLAEGEREPWDPGRYAVRPVHARRTYKSTTKIGKLKADADAAHARLFVILESDQRCTVQDLDGMAAERREVGIEDLVEVVGEMLGE